MQKAFDGIEFLRMYIASYMYTSLTIPDGDNPLFGIALLEYKSFRKKNYGQGIVDKSESHGALALAVFVVA